MQKGAVVTRQAQVRRSGIPRGQEEACNGAWIVAGSGNFSDAAACGCYIYDIAVNPRTSLRLFVSC
jgi:hypothetical protein